MKWCPCFCVIIGRVQVGHNYKAVIGNNDFTILCGQLVVIKINDGVLSTVVGLRRCTTNDIQCILQGRDTNLYTIIAIFVGRVLNGFSFVETHLRSWSGRLIVLTSFLLTPVLPKNANKAIYCIAFVESQIWYCKSSVGKMLINSHSHRFTAYLWAV